MDSKNRDYWISRIQKLWTEKSIVWLSGVRRVGKTTLSKQLPDTSYFNCDLPSIQKRLEDPEFFFSSLEKGSKIVLDEVHQIDNPSGLLKIAADEYPEIKILATGSSTLSATKKFRDSLTDRKRSLFLPPVLWQESFASFSPPDFEKRLLHGGLPAMTLADEVNPEFFGDWLDSFYARDIQELFNIRNRTGFIKLLTLIIHRCGGLLDISDLAKESGLSRPTVMSHLDAMEIAHTIFRLSPYHGGSDREIKKQPKVYAFDTGIVCYVRGWKNIRNSDRGHLWEQLVLDELRVKFQEKPLHYWRDKSRREIDFVIEKSSKSVDIIEAKMSADSLEINNFAEFRRLYPEGENFVVSPFVDKPYQRKMANLVVTICRPDQLPDLP